MSGQRVVILAAIGFFLLAIGILASSLWWISSLSPSATPTDTVKVVGAVLVLVGTLFTGVVTFFGLLLKHSIDRRTAELQRLESDRNAEQKQATEERLKLEFERNLALKEEAERRLQLEFERNLALQKNAEKRLKLETGLRALELFRAGVDSNASTSEAAGALFALIELDHLGFALRLLKQLWPQERIDAAGAMWVLNRALNAGSSTDQEEAAELLRAYAEKLPDGRGGHVWLQPPESWKPQLSLSARDSLLQALLRCFLSRELGYWEEQYLVGTALLLAHLLESDSSPLVQAGAILALEQLLQTHRHCGVITHGSRAVDLASLRRQVAERAAWARTQASPLHHDLAAQLQRWRKRERKNVPGVSSPQRNC